MKRNVIIKKTLKSRLYHIVQHFDTVEEAREYEKNIIAKALKHKIVIGYAYILHDKDTEFENDAKGNLIEKPKRPHYHILLQLKEAYSLSRIAKWFCVEDNFVDKVTGHGGFISVARYLIHIDDKTQFQYSPDEVICNFNYDQVISAGKKLVKKSQLDQWIEDVAQNGKTLDECYKENAKLYVKNLKKLKQAEEAYLNNKKLPFKRISIYVFGKASVGKDCCCHALSKSLIGKDSVFAVAQDKAGFNGYKGEEVLCWSDFRSQDIIKVLGGIGNVYIVFNPEPSDQRVNVKFGTVKLLNKVNFVNGQEDYVDFLNGLTKKGEDSNQAYRRFPYIIHLLEDYLILYVNRGYATGDINKYKDYDVIKMRGSFAEIAKKTYDVFKEEALQKLCRPIVDIINKTEDSVLFMKNNDLDISHYGEIIEDDCSDIAEQNIKQEKSFQNPSVKKEKNKKDLSKAVDKPKIENTLF